VTCTRFPKWTNVIISRLVLIPVAESEQFSDGNEMGGELFALASEHNVFLVGKAKVVRANASFKGNTKVSGTKRLLAVRTVILILKLKRALKLLND